jgi:hypothetical protein
LQNPGQQNWKTLGQQPGNNAANGSNVNSLLSQLGNGYGKMNGNQNLAQTPRQNSNNGNLASMSQSWNLKPVQGMNLAESNVENINQGAQLQSLLEKQLAEEQERSNNA